MLLLLLAAMVALALVAAWALGAMPGPAISIGVGLHRLVVWIVFVVLLLGLGVAAFRWLLRPVASLVDAAETVSRGDLAVRVEERGPRDVRVLARAFNDMTGRLSADEERRQAFLAEITHELRTPLTVIQGDLEALLDGVYARDDEHLASILDESRHLGRLIEDLRALALVDAGKLAVQTEPVDPAGLATDALASFEAQATEAGIATRCDAGEGLPLVMADPTRIRQVLANLIGNALRYAPKGGFVVVSVARAGASSVRFTVADDGAGIAPELLPHVFDRFRHAPDSPGSGLGLTIARDIVAAHGGSIEAHSDGPGRGTQVSFTLPG